MSIYEYNDFRDFLTDSLKKLQDSNPNYSATAFCRKAGFGENSRGYFGLIINKKRNLGPKGIRGFARALKLSEREALHFENLVSFNQAQAEEEKRHAYNRLKKSMRTFSRAYEILSSQYHYLSSWYYVAIRELVALKDFSPDESWISQKLKKRVTKKQVRQALADLQSLGTHRSRRWKVGLKPKAPLIS